MKTAKEQVIEAIKAGLTLKQTLKKVKGTTKGTVKYYFYSLRKELQFKKEFITQKVSIKDTLPTLSRPTLINTKEHIIGKIMDSELSAMHKKAFVLFAVNQL